MLKNKTIALDTDGVLLDFMPAFDKAAAIVLGRPIIIQQDEYNMDYYYLSKRISVTQEQVEEILEYMQTSRMYENLAALKGAKEGVKAIEEAGFNICIVTALPEQAKLMRRNNLRNVLGLEPQEIYCVGMGMSKAEILKELKPDVFMDDRIEYLASAPFIYHLAWVDQKEVQIDKTSMVDVRVSSLKEWTDNHMKKVAIHLNRHYQDSHPLQMPLKFENVNSFYSFNNAKGKKYSF